MPAISFLPNNNLSEREWQTRKQWIDSRLKVRGWVSADALAAKCNSEVMPEEFHRRFVELREKLNARP